MAQATVKLPVKTEERPAPPASALAWRPFEALRREVDRLFEDFDEGSWSSPFRPSMFGAEPSWRRESAWGAAPAVDIAESDKAYEITADLPGIDEKNIEVKLTNGDLRIKGEKQKETEEKQKDYYLHERHFGSFERAFRIPEGVDTDKIQASFTKGVLTVTLPKTTQAQKAEKKIAIKSA